MTGADLIGSEVQICFNRRTGGIADRDAGCETTEDRGRKTEDGGQRTEDRRRRADGREKENIEYRTRNIE